VANASEEYREEMISVEAWTTIRYLHAQGKGVRAIAAELGIARNTVRAALRDDQPARYQRPSRPNPQLLPYTDAIGQMALEQQLIGSRILRELQARGYTGGKTALYRYLHTLRASIPSRRVTERFETAPGQQGQFDWSPYTVMLGEQPTKLVAFGLTLGFSRRKHYWLSRDESQPSVFEALEAGFRHFGGVPKELLVDNAKVFVTDARPTHFTWNRHFLELCGHYAVQPVACHPYRPQTKGKVERPFFYLEQHFIKGHTWPGFDDLTRDLAHFVADDLDVRIHSTTQERPLDRFQWEQPHLTPLPTRPFVGTHEQSRSVSWDCLVSFAGSRYSVPWAYAGQRVWVRPSQGVRLTVRNPDGELIASHQLAARKGQTVIDPAHYIGLRAGVPKTRALLSQTFLARFPDHGWLVEGVFRQHPPNGVAHLRAMLALADLYPQEAMHAAFAAARQYDTYAHRFIRGLLEADRPPAPAAVRAAAGAAAPPSAVTADLGVYQALLEGRP
jgi:transposase